MPLSKPLPGGMLMQGRLLQLLIVGGCVVGRSIVVAQTFGFVSYGLLMGVIDMAHQLGAAIGIWFPSHLFDISGNYISGIYFFLGCYVVCLLLLRRTQILWKRQAFPR